MTERDFAIEVVRKLRAANYQALWAGGCVRDELLGLQPHDYDVATDARPDQVQALFPRTIAIGKAFGVVEVLGPRTPKGFLKIQVATFRRDIYDALAGVPAAAAVEPDGRHPVGVAFCTAEEDAKRRDFTINGMFFDPLEKLLIDHVGGQDDLRRKILRAIGAPQQRFAEDKLRMLRAVRMAVRFDLTIEPATRAAIGEMAAQITTISAERIADELRHMLVHPRRALALDLLLELGLIGAVLPELLPMKGLPQGPPSAPTGDLWDHVLRVLELLGADVSFPLAFAALLHDAGKPRSVGRTPDRYTFYGHEHIGRRLAGDIAQRLKLSNAERERVEWLVEKHQILSDAPRMRQSKLKTLLAHPGSRELLDLHRADARASGRSTDHVDFCEKRLPIALPEPLLSGDDLIGLGLKPGKNFKELLDAAWEAQLEDRIKTKAEAIEQVKKSLDESDQGQASQPTKSADELYQEARARWAKAVDIGVHDDEKVIYGVTPILEKALQENQKHVKSLALLSDLLMAAGADEEASQLLARLLELEPDTTVHHEKMALLRQKRSKERSDEIRHYLAMKWLTTEDW